MDARQIWRSNEKSEKICKNCPLKNEDCLLKGQYDKDANLTFVIENPDEKSIQTEVPLRESEGTVLEELTDKLNKVCSFDLKYNVVYAVAGFVDKRPSKDTYTACHNYVERKLVASKRSYERNVDEDDPHVIVPMGNTAAKSFDLGERSIRKMRGNHYEKNIEGHTFHVYPTLGLANILGQPGVTRLVIRDLIEPVKKAYLDDGGTTDFEALVEDYRTPTDPDEIEALVDDIIAYTDPEKREDPDDWPISIDTETNTLKPYRDDAKIIMVSVAWDDQLAASFPVDHPSVDYSAEERQKVYNEFKRLMACSKPKVFHNAKFDWQFIELTYDVPVNNLAFDTLCGEHIIDESKRGYNGLKTLVDIYAKDYSGYEDRLHEALRSDRAKKREIETIDEWMERECWSSTDSNIPGIMHYFPSVRYDPVTRSDPYWNKLSSEERKEMAELEIKYVRACRDEDQDAKKKARDKVRRRCKKYDIEYPDTASDMKISEMDGGFEDLPVDSLLLYAAADADVTRIICKKQQRHLIRKDIKDDADHLMDTFYMPATKALGEMEFTGTRINQELLDKYEEEVSKLESRAEQKLRDIVIDDEFNPNSKDDRAWAIEKRLGFDEEDIYRTDEGNISTAKKYLKAWIDKFDQDDRRGQFARYLDVHRSANKAKSTFIDGLRKLSAYDGRVHTQFNLNGTATGRLSSSQMNLQNIPKWMCRFNDYKDESGEPVSEGWNIKKAFIPTDDSYVFWHMDISSAEIRVLCAYANDKKLKDALNRGLDTHSLVASEVFDMDYDYIVENKESDPDVEHKRTVCKRIVYGTLYGASDYRLAIQIYGELSNDPEEKQEQIDYAKEIKNIIYEQFEGLKSYIQSTHREVKRDGKVQSLSRRYRRFRMQGANYRQKSRAMRQAVNFKIQSASSDILVSQLCEAIEPIKNIGGRILLTVHDSIAGEIKRDKVHELEPFFDKWVVDRVKERFEWLPVPFEYDMEVGPNYGELVDYDELKKPVEDLDSGDVKYLKKADLIHNNQWHEGAPYAQENT